MGVREGHEGEEWIVLVRTALNIFDRFIRDPRRWVTFFWHGCSVGLWAGIIVIELIGWVVQFLPIWDRFAEPLAVMAATLIPMTCDHIHMLEAVVWHLEGRDCIPLEVDGLL